MSTSSHDLPSRFLVTGGAGFIGYRVTSLLLEASPKSVVAVVDNLSVGMPMPVSGTRLTAFEADIRHTDEMQCIFSEFKPDTVIHLAAVHHIPTCEQKRSYSLDVNVIGTETLLQVSEEQAVKRFVLASSGAVYDWTNGELHEDRSPLRAADNYSLAKLTNEKQVSFWNERVRGRARIARIFNTIGHDDPNAHLIPDIIRQIPTGEKHATVKLGNTAPRRDYIHADDTAAAIAAIAYDNSEVATDVLNVCSGADKSVSELVELLGDVMGTQIEISEDLTRKRRVDRPSQLGNRSKFESRFSTKLSKTLKIALEDIVRHSKRALR
jgi:UDP-glucose 4-epimerase